MANVGSRTLSGNASLRRIMVSTASSGPARGLLMAGGLKAQAEFNIAALEKAINQTVLNREEIITQQHQAARWTFIGSGLVHERFKATVENISPKAAARLAEAAPIFA